MSIALGVLEVAAEEAERHGHARVIAIHLKLGPLSGVVREALLSAFELARECSPLPNAALVIEDCPIVVNCVTCAAERPVACIQLMSCAVCGTPAGRIIAGRELEVVALELES
jgi:hydrogenase nickel incorporation protein HypA/HybF